MDTKESIAYLKGLIEGSDFEMDKKVKKVVDALLNTLTTLADEVLETNDRIDDTKEDVSDLRDTLEVLSHTILRAMDSVGGYLDDDDDMDSVLCPNCGEEVLIDEDDWIEGSIVCYECGTVIDLELDDDDDDPFDDDED